MACRCKKNNSCKCNGQIMKLGRSQGDTDFICPDGMFWSGETSECLPIKKAGQKCPIGFQWHTTLGCVPIRQAPIENSPNQTPVNPNLDIYGTKPLRVCDGLTAPNGYHFIRTAKGCALAVNYDSNIQPQPTTPNNPISNLLGAIFGTNQTTATGETATSGISGFIAQNKGLVALVVLGGGAYLLSKNKRPTPKTYDRTESYKY